MFRLGRAGVIRIDLSRQVLEVTRDGQCRTFAVSTALHGAGEEEGSGCTPRGLHRIAEKIGADAPAGTVFKGRVATGEIYSAELAANNPDRDWILSRILWLEGAEPGRNCGGTVDTRSRYIYIHGTNEEDRLGAPVSHGCIRMANADVIALFDAVAVGDTVTIDE